MNWAPPPHVLSLALIFVLQFSLNPCSSTDVDLHRNEGDETNGAILPMKKSTFARKLLGIGNNAVMDRMGDSCSKDDIVVYQGATAPLPNGIPTYTVQILNVCLSDCAVSDIHISCGWFSSARLINPRIFRRIGFDDCLVNDGAPLGPGESLSFQYANTYRYPLYVSSVACYED